MSANRRIEARVMGSFRVAATASASGRLLLQATIFISLGRKRESSDRLDPGLMAFYQRPLRLSMNGGRRRGRWRILATGLTEYHVVDATGGFGGNDHGDIGPVMIQRASGNIVELDHFAAFVAGCGLHRPL